jgi:hypothetical protein
MPQFVLNTPPVKAHPFYALSSFERGYVEAMFFTNGDTGDENEWHLNDLGVERLTLASIASIKSTCADFLASLMPDGRTASEWIDDEQGDDEQAGRDFWFTRQGHGVGFWDRSDDVWSEPARDALSDAAHDMGEAYVEAYRGWIYHR